VTLEGHTSFEEALRGDDPRALYEQAPCGYVSVSSDGLVIKANQTILSWTGYTSSDLHGNPVTSFLTMGSRLFYETSLRPVLLLEGQVKEIALDMIKADGNPLPVLINAVLDRAEDGSPTITRIAVFDATERRHYEQQLLAAKERAEVSERHATELARTLQETLMPPRDPQIDGLEVATAYRPAGDGSEIGGDFYDVFEVAEADWVVTLGDVAGKGVNAAVVATLARYTIRALSVSEASPAEVLRQLNLVLLNHPTERFCTAVVLRMRRIGDVWDVVMATGGHHPAIVMDSDRTPHTIGEASPLIGAFDTSDFLEVHFELRPGATLLLHTDGITEARNETEGFYGDERLLRLLHDNTDDPQTLVRIILQDVLDFQGERTRDDIALIALQVPQRDR